MTMIKTIYLLHHSHTDLGYTQPHYAVSCDGVVNFRFFLASGDAAPTHDDAKRLAAELSHPAIAVPFPGSAR